MRKNDFAGLPACNDQVRRPLAVRIAQDLRRQHPTWPDEDVQAEAKAQAIAQLQGKERAAA